MDRLLIYADAYERPLSDAEKKPLAENPSYFAELYIMRADGTDQRRLTNTPGYDGGPFFTHDGARIVWRRFDESGADRRHLDYEDRRHRGAALTDFASMSWAPYEHPSGEYFFFSSNKFGFANFELFIVDSQGMKEPVRMTYTEGFDGLPCRRPTAGQLAWTSAPLGRSARQIYLAQWNHEQALAALAKRRRGERPAGKPMTAFASPRHPLT